MALRHGRRCEGLAYCQGPRLRCIDQLAVPAMAFLNNPRRRPAMPMNWLSLETVISDAVATIRKCSGRHNAPMDLHLLCVVDFRELSTSLWQLECEQVERLDAQCHGYDRRDRPPRRGIERLRGTVASFMRRVGLRYDGCEQGGRNVTMIKFKGSHFERDVILWGVRGLVARRFRKARRRYRGINSRDAQENGLPEFAHSVERFDRDRNFGHTVSVIERLQVSPMTACSDRSTLQLSSVCCSQSSFASSSARAHRRREHVGLAGLVMSRPLAPSRLLCMEAR